MFFCIIAMLIGCAMTAHGFVHDGSGMVWGGLLIAVLAGGGIVSKIDTGRV